MRRDIGEMGRLYRLEASLIKLVRESPAYKAVEPENENLYMYQINVLRLMFCMVMSTANRFITHSHVLRT